MIDFDFVEFTTYLTIALGSFIYIIVAFKAPSSGDWTHTRVINLVQCDSLLCLMEPLQEIVLIGLVFAN